MYNVLRNFGQADNQIKCLIGNVVLQFGNFLPTLAPVEKEPVESTIKSLNSANIRLQIFVLWEQLKFQ